MKKKLQILAHDLEIITQHALSTYPLECCGLLLGRVNEQNKVIESVVATTNDWENQKHLFVETSQSHRHLRDSFSINPLTFLQIQKQAREDNLEIVGIYHSHPDHPAIPSAFDQQFAWARYSYIIISVNQSHVETVSSWSLNDSRQFMPEELHILV